jgi:GNAT superfamily N-acetyltransferase
MITEFQINTAPTQLDLEKIEKWLIEEDRESNEGFYCNWTIITKAFKNKELVTLDFKESPIGFLVWSNCENYAEIDIFEIHPEHRKKGFGQVFFDKISENFKRKEFIAIKLFCSPRESEKFWKKMGFIKFPNRGYSESDLIYFKPLIEISATSKNVLTENKVELWDVEPYQKDDNLPKWTWNIEIKNNKLILPIIHPCNCNWNLRWTKNGKTIREDKVKYFDTKKNRVEYGPFLYIEKLIE